MRHLRKLPGSLRGAANLLFGSPGEAAYALLVPALGLVCGLALLMLLATSLLTAIVQIGLVLLIGTLAAARAIGALHRALLRGMLGEDIPAPPERQRPRGLRSALTDGDDWRAAAFTVAYTPVGLVLFAVWVMGRYYGLAALTYPLWWRAIEEDGHYGIGFGFGIEPDTWPQALITAVAGAGILGFTTWSTRGLLDRVVRPMAQALIGPGRLETRVQELQETRALAVKDSAATLRRIERDLHDGAQARLVAVAMALAGAKDQLARVPGDAPELARGRELVDSALDGSRTAIKELRDLVRGIHPPALDDGLDVALETLVSGYDAPQVTLNADLPERPPEAIETIAYFCAAELIANAAKHAGATRADVAAYTKDGTLRLSVTDDGHGGARPRAGGGTGLAGLSERVSTVDGRLLIDSPAGGPTTATVELPLDPRT
ncbi:sensor histidine kinase [Streptomyces sp. FIT100]|uniref:sensor histidine kinase n=1 Tax=Streptomyces sp. FIT100 TaxID=2837956 RepID=UPI0021CA2EFF|nr:sensor histidine kinase [Streptomyces sp. FIT100]UUN25598.1 sensor domain-containing protein [Streptomyces sp. FIT100]